MNFKLKKEDYKILIYDIIFYSLLFVAIFLLVTGFKTQKSIIDSIDTDALRFVMAGALLGEDNQSVATLETTASMMESFLFNIFLYLGLFLVSLIILLTISIPFIHSQLVKKKVKSHHFIKSFFFNLSLILLLTLIIFLSIKFLNPFAGIILILLAFFYSIHLLFHFHHSLFTKKKINIFKIERSMILPYLSYIIVFKISVFIYIFLKGSFILILPFALFILTSFYVRRWLVSL